MSLQEALRSFINAEKGCAADRQKQHSCGRAAEQALNALFLQDFVPDGEETFPADWCASMLVLNLESHQLCLQNVLRRGEEARDRSSTGTI